MNSIKKHYENIYFKQEFFADEREVFFEEQLEIFVSTLILSAYQWY